MAKAMARRSWSTPEGLVFEGIQTGDGRLFAPNSITWEDQPNGWPYRYSPEDQGGHWGALVVGAIDTLTRTGDAVGGTGWIEDSIPEGAALVERLDAGLPIGTSVDVDDMAVEFVATEGDDEDDDGGVVILAANLPTAGRLTFFPAADRPGEVERVELHAAGLRSIVAAATALAESRGLVAAGWQAPALVAAAGEGEPEGVVLFTDSMDEVILRVTRARLRGATAVDMPAYHRAAIVLDGAASTEAPADDEPVTDDDADAAAVAASASGCTDCPPVARVGAEPADQLAALIAAASAPMRPAAGWFDDPKFGRDDVVEVEDPNTGRTLRGVPMEYTAEGEVVGHVALWGQCHTGSAEGQCVLTPRSKSGYAYFHHGVVELDDGTMLPVGNLTLGGGHADVKLSYRAALSHYDDVGTLACQVRAGEDAYGVWVHGAGMPDVWSNDLSMRKLRAASPSGDWRWIGGALDLAHTHAVNAPGFPVPRAQVASSGEVTGLVAAGAADVARLAQATPGAAGGVDVAAIAAAAAAAAVEAFVNRQADTETREQARAQIAAASDRLDRRNALRRLTTSPR